MLSSRKLIAVFFTNKQTTIHYYLEDKLYFFQDGSGKSVLSSSQGDFEKAKQEIMQIYKVESVKRIK
jgi:hypothetical protein